tara:strand:- start:188 stop:397 length:210 start_codon:yes stop_codon:yes gene_type:complete
MDIKEQEVTVTEVKLNKEELVELFVQNIEALKEYGALDDKFSYKFTLVTDESGGDIAHITLTKVRERSL